MVAKHCVNTVHRGFNCGDRGVNRHHVIHLAKSIYKDQNNCSVLLSGSSPKINSSKTDRQASALIDRGRMGACDDGDGCTR